MKRYSIYLPLFLFLHLLFPGGTLSGQPDTIDGYTIIEVGPEAESISLKLVNGNEEPAKDITIILINESRGVKFKRIDFPYLGTDNVDDNYDKKIDGRDEKDQTDSTPSFRGRSILGAGEAIAVGDTVSVDIDFTGETGGNAKIGIRFSKLRGGGVHSDMVENTPIGPMGQPTTLTLSPGLNGAATRLVNQTGEFISVVNLVLPEQPLEDLALEAPYHNSEIPLGTGRETMIFFEPPLAPFDQASLYIDIAEPVGFAGAQMQFFVLESFPPDCSVSINAIEVGDCGGDNTYGVAVDVDLNTAVRRSKEYTFTNNLDQSVNDLHAIFSGTGGDLTTHVLMAPEGCDNPKINNDEVSNRMDIVWPAACIAPGKSVRIRVSSTNAPPRFEGGYWTVDGRNVGELKEVDVSEGPEYGAGNDGFQYYLDGVLVGQGPAVSGLQTIDGLPGGDQPATLTVALTGPLSCEFSQTFMPPTCAGGGPYPLGCGEMDYRGPDIAPGNYSFTEVDAGASLIFNDPAHQIREFYVIPPVMLDLADSFVCSEDYFAILDAPNLPASTVEVTFRRPGPYFIHYLNTNGDWIDEVILVGMEPEGNPDAPDFCVFDTWSEIPCGTPDVALLSSTNGTPNRWGEAGLFVTSIDSMKRAICRLYEEKGEPLDVVINAHGNDGIIQIGDEFLTLDNLEAFAAAMKGKIKELVLMSCNVASSEAGRRFVQTLADKLGVKVTAYSGKVGVTKEGLVRWYATGPAYSRTGTTTAVYAAEDQFRARATVFPNPFSQQAHIRLNTDLPAGTRYAVYRGDGTLVSAHQLAQVSKGSTLPLNLAGEPAGIYLLQLRTQGLITTQRLVKLR